MPGWLTLAEHVHTPYHARVLKNTRRQVMSFVQRLKSVATPVKSAQQLGSNSFFFMTFPSQACPTFVNRAVTAVMPCTCRNGSRKTPTVPPAVAATVSTSRH